MRKKTELNTYLDEAFDKVWICRSHPCDNPDIEKQRIKAVKKIEKMYSDLPEDDWSYGYWSGVLATLRWVMGDEEKMNLDT